MSVYIKERLTAREYVLLRFSKFFVGIVVGLTCANNSLALGIEEWECKANSGEILRMDITGGPIDPPNSPNPNHPKGVWHTWGVGRVE